MNLISAKVSVFSFPSTMVRTLFCVSWLHPYSGDKSRYDDVAATSLFLSLVRKRSWIMIPAKANKRLDIFVGCFLGSADLANNESKRSSGSGKFVGIC